MGGVLLFWSSFAVRICYNTSYIAENGGEARSYHPKRIREFSSFVELWAVMYGSKVT